MVEIIKLSNLPPFAKVFVGIFTTLMLLVCAWAVTILYVEKGMVKEGQGPLYLSNEETSADDLTRQEEAEPYAEDSGAVLAPIWDSDFAGRDLPADSLTKSEYLRQRYLKMMAEQNKENEEQPNFHENIHLAHTHVNGHTLLFFAMGVVFLFTSVKPRVKKIVYWIFGISVVLHAIGLTGEGYHWFFDDILIVSGVAILAGIVYMAMRIYVDLIKSS
jgi:hypothetical protein